MENAHYSVREIEVAPISERINDDHPKIKLGDAKTKGQLERLRKELNKQELTSKSNPNFITGNKRLKNKENALFRLNEIENRKTMKDIKDARKQEMEENYQKYYKKKVIEERELPKYFDHCKEWWRQNRNFKSSVGERSRAKLLQTQKFWAMTDRFLVSDVEGTDPPVDPFKTHRVIKNQSESKLNFVPTEKPNLVIKEKYRGETKKKTAQRWSLGELKSKGHPKERFHVKSAYHLSSDAKPLISTFSKTGFIDTECHLDIEGPTKLNLKKLFYKVYQKNRLNEKRIREAHLEASLKLQERHNKVMFRTSVSKGIRTGSFKSPQKS